MVWWSWLLSMSRSKEQQAAMMGLPASEWTQRFFDETLPALCALHHPGARYARSTPTGGPLPFSTAQGLTHYYGVGAYKRPLTDVRRADVTFTPECLGFSNVPELGHLERHFGVGAPAPHHPAWKAGVPRDNGAGWDFEDVRDHYVRDLFGVDPVHLRYADLERYHAVSRVVTGELMLRTYAEWRRPGSRCEGALVWFLKDLRPGAGWGILDSDNHPKACFWYLKRAWAPRAVLLTDEGLDGVDLHVHNESDDVLDGFVELELVHRGQGRVYSQPVTLAPRTSRTLSGEALIGAFADLAYAYRFGPPRHEVVVARLVVDGHTVHEDALFPVSHTLPSVPTATLTASLEAEAVAGLYRLTLTASSFLQAISLGGQGFEPEDDYFHLVAGRPRSVLVRGPTSGLKVWITALNLQGGVMVRSG